MKRLIVATRNQGKMREMRELLEGLDLEITSLADYPDMPDIVEDGLTFKENALIKARIIATQMQCLVMGEDSGIAVDALDGRPGIYSARYAQDEDISANQKLLQELTDVPYDQRTARYHSAIALCDGDQEVGVVEDTCEGILAFEEKGSNGFGYDPLFIPEGYDQTFGELDPSIKAQLSHRAKALKQFCNLLSNYLVID